MTTKPLCGCHGSCLVFRFYLTHAQAISRLGSLKLCAKAFKKYTILISKGGGIILLLTGIAILTGQLQVLGFFILEYFPSLQSFG